MLSTTPFFNIFEWLRVGSQYACCGVINSFTFNIFYEQFLVRFGVGGVTVVIKKGKFRGGQKGHHCHPHYNESFAHAI